MEVNASDLLRLIETFSYYKKKAAEKKHKPNSKSILVKRQNNTLVSSTFAIPQRFSKFSPASAKALTDIFTPPEPAKGLYPAEVYECINDWFERIYLGAVNIGGSRIKNKKQVIHLENIKQFFLNTGLVTKKMLAKAVDKLKGNPWVDRELLIKSFEGLKLGIKKKSMKPAGYLIKKNIFELIFFFRLFQTADENRLNYGEVEKVLRVALRSCPELLPSSTLHALFKVSKSSLVSFREYFKFITSYL